ncbi:hypothetical protein J7T55_003069 [Diaporthe amygdali]|uniref:uncharacterized protein n=1 Tax=Phomopsis amygdali TaxID=1214568 RepID=UPI0022FE2FB7|nr:uncharacterized protein J7T55_003069 [Diaporthe amygdali]KAJ0122555.1 hypothetical protein J7T55_003069 [Diaporthe amygdali]
MSSVDQSLKRAASPDTAQEAQPNKRQKQQDDSHFSDSAHEKEEAIATSASVVPEEGTQQDPDTDTSTENEGDTTEEIRKTNLKRAKASSERRKWQKTTNKFSTYGNDTGYFSDELKDKGHNSRPHMSPDERKRLMEGFATPVCTSDSQSHEIEDRGPQMKVGLDFLSNFSATVDSPKDAAAFLDMDLQSLEISPKSTLRLRLDQVQNIAFMVKKAEGILKGCVNANDYGTGKTVEALASIFFLAQRKEALPDFNAHKVIFILCRHQALRGWKEVYEKYFSGLLNLYICSESLEPGESSQMIDPPSPSALAEFLGALSPSDPQTSRTVILSTYGELSNRRFLVKRKDKDAREKELSLRGSKLTEEASEAFKVAKKPELYDLNFDPAMIGTLIADEAHEIKHPKSNKAQAAYLLDAEVHFLLTANPVDNKVSDFRGLLFALYHSKTWQINWPQGAETAEFLRMFDDDFDPFQARGSGNFVPPNVSPEYVEALRSGQHLWRLNPHAYRWLGHHKNFGPEFSRRVLGSILRLCLLRRGVVSVAHLPSSGSSTISGIFALPPVSISTIEVGMTQEQQDYDKLAGVGFDNIFRAGKDDSAACAARVINDNETPVAAFNNSWDTFLSQITADFGLADVLKNPSFDMPASRKVIPDIDVLKQTNTDSGMSFYYSMTRRDNDPVHAPADRASMIRHIVRRSPKLRWLLVKLEELKQKGEKVIIYCVHPLTQWIIEGVCAMAEFNFLSLRSKPKHGDETRCAIIDDFNNNAKRYDFLLSTMRVLGHSVDLHEDCHNMIIFELPDSIPTMLSAIGRIRRVGQTKPQVVSILSMESSYDNYTQYRQSRKYAVSLLAFGVLGDRLDILASRVEAQIDRNMSEFRRQHRMSKRELSKLLETLRRDMPKLDVVKLLGAGELIRQLLGAQYNMSYIPWACRHKILYEHYRMKLSDFAGPKMNFNTSNGKQILRLAAQLPESGPALASVGSLPTLLGDYEMRLLRAALSRSGRGATRG